jgi:hypothetical protein
MIQGTRRTVMFSEVRRGEKMIGVGGARSGILANYQPRQVYGPNTLLLLFDELNQPTSIHIAADRVLAPAATNGSAEISHERHWLPDDFSQALFTRSNHEERGIIVSSRALKRV